MSFGLLLAVLLSSSVPAFPLGPWDKEVARGRLCGSLTARRCLIPEGVPTPKLTHCIWNFKTQQGQCNRTFCLFKPNPPYLKSNCKTCIPGVLQDWSFRFSLALAGRFPLEALAVPPSLPDPHSCPLVLPRKTKGSPGRSWTATLTGWTLLFRPPSPSTGLPTGLASGKSPVKKFQSKSTF